MLFKQVNDRYFGWAIAFQVAIHLISIPAWAGCPKASRDSWSLSNHEATNREPIPFSLNMDSDEFKWLELGLIPNDMDHHRWFVYLEENRLYFHRSWTGLLVYDCALTRDEAMRVVISDCYFNRNSTGYIPSSEWVDLELTGLLGIMASEQARLHFGFCD